MPGSHVTLRGDVERSGSADASVGSAEKSPSCKGPLKKGIKIFILFMFVKISSLEAQK